MQASIYNSTPDNFNFGGGSQDTVMHPAVAVAMAVVIVVMLVRPRKSILAPLFLFLFLVPSGQELYLSGVHLYCSRILILVGCSRLLWTKFSGSGKVLAGGLNTVDRVFIVWALYRALAGSLLFMQTAATINQFGFLWDTLGMYFLLRFLIRDRDDIERLFKVFAFVAIAIAAEMVREHYTHENLFAVIFGGLPARLEVRNGLLRAQAVFQHSLMAGTFGAALFPYFVWLWKGGRSRILGVLGMVASLTITLASSVSTPILAFAAAIGAICAWPIRKYMSYVRYGFVLALIGLAMVMKAPVWYLIARIDLVGGSTSYQRAELIDLFIRHASDWWLIGTNQNANWGWDMWDTTNEYVTEGLRGGIVAFVCLLVLIWLSFRNLSKARKAASADRNEQWFFWMLWSALFVYCVAFIGVHFFDQTRFAWYALLAVISASTAALPQSVPAAIGLETSGLETSLEPVSPRPAYSPVPVAKAPKERLRPSPRNQFDPPPLYPDRKEGI